jgi:Fe-S-cluster-containing hydrogenase component 2
LVRSGVPVFTSHTVLESVGTERVEKIRIAQVDGNFKPKLSSVREYACDTNLIAVGLDPVNEFIRKAEEVGLPVFSAGDAQEIAEASAAIFSGRIAGAQIAERLGKSLAPVPDEWIRLEEILKSKPGALREEDLPAAHAGVFPVLHCNQEIPCDPCTTICPKNLIQINGQDIRKIPQFIRSEAEECIGCLRCVSICPGLAITLVDFRKRVGTALVSLPYEQEIMNLKPGSLVVVTDTSGTALTSLPVKSIRQLHGFSVHTSSA